MLRLLAVLAVLITSCGKHNYIAIPRADVEENVKESLGRRPSQVLPRPTAVIATGNPDLVVGQSLTVHVDFKAVTEVELTQLVLMTLNQEGLFSGYWELELSAQELAAGAADLEVFALDEEPSKEWCQKDYRGLGTCYTAVDEGVTGLSIVPASNTINGFPGTTIPITLDAMEGGQDDSCSAFTAKQCCAGGAGIAAVACYVAPPCKCPSGTTEGGRQADGNLMCKCP